MTSSFKVHTGIKLFTIMIFFCFVRLERTLANNVSGSNFPLFRAISIISVILIQVFFYSHEVFGLPRFHFLYILPCNISRNNISPHLSPHKKICPRFRRASFLNVVVEYLFEVR